MTALGDISEIEDEEKVPVWHIVLLEARSNAFDESSPPCKPWREVLDRIAIEI